MFDYGDLLSQQPKPFSPVYLVEYLGDITGGKSVWHGKHVNTEPWNADGVVFTTLDDALEAINQDFPLEEVLDWDDNDKSHGTGQFRRSGPDPEDDRIVVWEILPMKHKKAVWHFSGWHWDSAEFGLDQGILPGDSESLYGMVME